MNDNVPFTLIGSEMKRVSRELTYAQRLAIIYRRCLQIYAESLQSQNAETDPVRPCQ